MKKLLLVLFLGSCVCAFGQGARFGDANPTQTVETIAGYSGLVVKVIPGATINFCSWPANAVPCTNKATTYTDYTLQSACSTSTQVVLSGTTSCVGTADSNGNWGVWVAPGLYQYTFTYQGNNYGPFFAVPTGNGTFSLNCPNAANLASGTAAVGAMQSPTGFNCDPNFLTDLAGNASLQSARFLGPVNGFYGLIGGASDPGTQAKFKLGTNEVRMLAPLTVPTPYYWRIPGTTCAVGQVWQMTGETTDANGDKVDAYGCLTPSNQQVIQVGGVNITTESPANFVAGTNITITNTSAGNIQISSAASTADQLGTPPAPTLANNNAAGARSISYQVVACQDTGCTDHTIHSATATIANANASPNVDLSVYFLTTNATSVRCYNIYVTADSGGRTTGLIGTCVDKRFTDTGGNGDGSTPPSTNTTAIYANPQPLPGCEIAQGGVTGIDAPPCTPNAVDREFTATSGFSGTTVSDPLWTGRNLSGSTMTLTNGLLDFLPKAAGAANIQCITAPVPGSTPWTYEATMYVTWPGGTPTSTGGLALVESSTGKIKMIGPLIAAGDQGDIFVTNWTTTNFTVFSTRATSAVGRPSSMQQTEPVTLKVSYDGTNVALSSSSTGVGFPPAVVSEAKTTFFTTAPDSIGLCVDEESASQTLYEFDWVRKVQ